MKPALRLSVLALLALPVFFGWTPFDAGHDLVPGLGPEPVLGALLALVGVGGVCGGALLASALAVTALILTPVVFIGATVAWLGGVLGGAPPAAAGSLSGAHYVGLAVNMLGVIPLALALVTAIPFDRFEQHLLTKTSGISLGEKYLLMFMRVFHHTVYFVIPNILEVVREEALLRSMAPFGRNQGASSAVRRLTAGLIQVGVGGICAALRFIPLWAREIDALPRRTSNRHRRKM